MVGAGVAVMADSITVLVFDKKQQIMDKLQRELWWYDADHGEMLKFIGGRLDLVNKVFDPERNRLVPKVLDVIVPRTETSSDAFKKWLNQYTNYNVSGATVLETVADGTLIEIPVDEADSCLYDLERNNLRFRIE